MVIYTYSGRRDSYIPLPRPSPSGIKFVGKLAIANAEVREQLSLELREDLSIELRE